MSLIAVFSAVVVSLCVLITPAQAGVVTFDEIDASGGDVYLAGISPYQGFNWSNFSAYTSTPGFQGFNNGIVSGANAAYSGGEIFSGALTPVVGAITSSTLFDFSSVYLGAGYYDDLIVTLTGVRAGVSVYNQSVTVNTAGATLFNFGFIGIDTLLIQGGVSATSSDPFGCGTFNCTQFTVDDLTTAPSAFDPPTGVPEPGTLALVTAALFGLYCTRRKT